MLSQRAGVMWFCVEGAWLCPYDSQHQIGGVNSSSICSASVRMATAMVDGVSDGPL